MRSVPHDLEIGRQEESLEYTKSPLEKIDVRGLRKTVTGFVCMGIAVLMSATNFGAFNPHPSGTLKTDAQDAHRVRAGWGDFWHWVISHGGSCPVVHHTGGCVLGVRG